MTSPPEQLYMLDWVLAQWWRIGNGKVAHRVAPVRNRPLADLSPMHVGHTNWYELRLDKKARKCSRCCKLEKRTP